MSLQKSPRWRLRNAHLARRYSDQAVSGQSCFDLGEFTALEFE
jgi:hypothetical protein